MAILQTLRNTLGSHNPDEADAVVVGAGPAGVIAAKHLAENGFDVVCLEQGTWPDLTQSALGRTDGGHGPTSAWDLNPNMRQLPGDYPIDDSASDVTPVMWNGVGGGSVMWAAQWTRNHPSDFRVRSIDGVADDWPIEYSELVPYYERVERDFAVSGFAGDPAFPDRPTPPLPAAPMREGGKRMAGAMNKLGWHWWPGSNAIATRATRNLHQCQQLAACGSGCPIGAKASVELTHWPAALKAGVKLRTHARVQKIEHDRRGLATGVLYRLQDGTEHFQKASVVIVAGNGLGTARLLLLSASNLFPEGLGNTSGLVGRRLMVHPFATVAGLFDEEVGLDRGVWGHILYSLQFYETDQSRGFVRGAKWGLVPTGGPEKSVSAYPWGDASNIWGNSFHEQVRRRWKRSMAWGIIAEDLPDHENRVELSHNNIDKDGLPGVKVTYKRSENTRKLMNFHLSRAEESLREAGATETVRSPLLRETAWHLLGTAKMGDDPSDSVVDKWGRSHDVPNLFVLDGSTWPTSSGMNPTATVAAFALRGAEHIVSSSRTL